MASKKNLSKLRPRGRKALFALFARRTKTAVGQWAKGRFPSQYLDRKLREWTPPASNGDSGDSIPRPVNSAPLA